MKAPLRYALVASLFTSIAVPSTHAVLLVSFGFTGAAGNEASFNPDVQAANTTVSPMTRGSGVNPTSGSGTFSASSWTTDPALDPDDYFSFSIAPEPGYRLTVGGLELDERRSGTGIRGWAVYSSLDGFASPLASFTVPDDSNTRTNQSLATIGSPFENIASPIEFRIYGFAAESASGTWRIDNVEVYGEVFEQPVVAPPAHSVPEPVAWADLAGLAGLGVLVAWRRKVPLVS